jgi:hypothetical protein
MRRGPGRERWDGRLAVEQRPTRSFYHGKSPDGESEDFGKGKKMRRYRSGFLHLCRHSTIAVNVT